MTVRTQMNDGGHLYNIIYAEVLSFAHSHVAAMDADMGISHRGSVHGQAMYQGSIRAPAVEEGKTGDYNSCNNNLYTL